jgi:hypothetical protein
MIAAVLVMLQDVAFVDVIRLVSSFSIPHFQQENSL